MPLFADVVPLAEEPFALGGIGDGFVFDGLGNVIDRGLDDSPTVWFEHSVDLAACEDIVIDMFHDMVTEYHIECIGLKWDLMDIHFDFGQRRLDISSDVIKVFHGLHPVNKAKLRSDMKDFEFIRKEVGLLLQKKPHQPMPFQSKAVWAECIVTTFSSIRQKLPERMVADITSHLISLKKYRHNSQKKVRN